MDWCGCTGRKLADTLHASMELLAAEVKCDGTVETVETLGQGSATSDTFYGGFRGGERYAHHRSPSISIAG